MWFAVSCHPDSNALDGRRPRVEVLHVSPCLRVPMYFWDRQCVLPGCPCRGEHYVFAAPPATVTGTGVRRDNEAVRAAATVTAPPPPRPLRRSATTLSALRWKFWKKVSTPPFVRLIRRVRDALLINGGNCVENLGQVHLPRNI